MFETVGWWGCNQGAEGLQERVILGIGGATGRWPGRRFGVVCGWPYPDYWEPEIRAAAWRSLPRWLRVAIRNQTAPMTRRTTRMILPAKFSRPAGRIAGMNIKPEKSYCPVILEPELEQEACLWTARQRREAAAKMRRWARQLEVSAFILERRGKWTKKPCLRVLTPDRLARN